MQSCSHVEVHLFLSWLVQGGVGLYLDPSNNAGSTSSLLYSHLASQHEPPGLVETPPSALLEDAAGGVLDLDGDDEEHLHAMVRHT